jgi:hypothetical protein
MWLELGIEVEVVVAQPFELGEIFVVVDGGEPAADLAEAVALRVIGELAVVEQGVQHVGLADRDELIPIVGSVRVRAIGRARCHGRLAGPAMEPPGRTPSRRR